MSNQRPHQGNYLPPLKVRSWENKDKNDEKRENGSLSKINAKSISTSTLTPLDAKMTNCQALYANPEENEEKPLIHLVDTLTDPSSNTAELSEETSPEVDDFKFPSTLSPRSAADVALRKALDTLRTYKTPRGNQQVIADLRKCTHQQATLTILRDCCVRLRCGNAFVERLRSLVETERKCLDAMTRVNVQDVTADVESIVLKEMEMISITESLQTNSNHWFYVKQRVITTDILHPMDNRIKGQLMDVKRQLSVMVVNALTWTRRLLELIVRNTVRLDAAKLATNSSWGNFVEMAERYNDVFSRLSSTSDQLTLFTIEQILRLVATECAQLGVGLFYDTLTKPLTCRDPCCTSEVEWLPKNKLFYRKELLPSLLPGKSDPLTNDVNVGGDDDVTGVEDDLVSRLLSYITDTSSLLGNLVECSPSKEKCVRWFDKSNRKPNPRLMNLYIESLRDEIGRCLEEKWVDLGRPVIGGTAATIDGSVVQLGSVSCWKDSMVLEVVAKAEELATTVDAVHVAEIFKRAASCLRLRAALSAWDERFCWALTACANHRFPSLLTSGTLVGTEAGFALTRALEPLLALLPALRHGGQANPWDLPEMLVIPCLRTTLCLAFSWLDNSIHRLLTTWHIGQYLLITHSDLKRLVDLLKHLSSTCPSAFESPGPQVSLAWRFHDIQTSEWWDNVNITNTEIEHISASSIKKFYRKCYQMSAEGFVDHMPAGKLWRRKYRPHGSPSDHSPYVDDIITTVLEPVLDGVKHLSMPVQISVISMATKAFCEAWMTYVCKHKIKFSFHGAQLFRLDVVHLTSWLQSVPEISTEARQSIQALDVLRRLHGSSLLLMRQPRSHQRLRKTKVSPIMSIADLNSDADKTDNETAVDGTLEDLSNVDSLTDEDFVPNKEEWLALRLHGAANRWQSLWCLSHHYD